MPFPGIYLPSYGNIPGFVSYQKQHKRGKLVNNVQAPAFAHNISLKGNNIGKDIASHWVTQGSDLLERALKEADQEHRHIVERLFVQAPIVCLCPANEQDVVKVCHAHLLHCVEEIFGRLPIVLGTTNTFRSLAEHETYVVQSNETFGVRKGNTRPDTVVSGPASLRPDNLYVLVREHDKFEPARLQDHDNVIVSSGLEMKKRGGVPVKICQSVIRTSHDDLQGFLYRETLDDENFVLTPRVLKTWESLRLQNFQQWIDTGSAYDEEGFGDAERWAQQMTAYAVGLNTQFIVGLDYDGLVLARFHRLRKRPAFGDRWNLGRGGGFCCQMAVYDSETSDSFLPAIVGFLAQANQDCLKRPRVDESQEDSSDSGGSRRTESSPGDPMDVDMWATGLS